MCVWKTVERFIKNQEIFFLVGALIQIQVKNPLQISTTKLLRQTTLQTWFTTVNDSSWPAPPEKFYPVALIEIATCRSADFYNPAITELGNCALYTDPLVIIGLPNSLFIG